MAFGVGENIQPLPFFPFGLNSAKLSGNISEYNLLT